MPSKKRRTNSQNFPDPIPTRQPKDPRPTAPKSKSVDELFNLTKEQLKQECRKRGQKSTGNKQELVGVVFSVLFLFVSRVFIN
ncbi:hypothetical protein GWI33_000351 [Rhynchophorus ferrugineus]|uniref:SAP domain-containing protein n=1 Tax=Rhynchophorus ferrugineus TaxID=354439 RepID=A0A834MIF0_RHYFE|nr:hypothetical protein GWI33_000351 [Rhynchophorus ferrugineus]